MMEKCEKLVKKYNFFKGFCVRGVFYLWWVVMVGVKIKWNEVFIYLWVVSVYMKGFIFELRREIRSY